MKARVGFKWDGRPQVATLSDDGVWSCTDSEWEAVLNKVVQLLDFGPSKGNVWRAHVENMARVMGGKVTSNVPEDTTADGVIY
jgi:hypothetical protein